VVRHIEKELAEIRKDPGDLVEWVDVILLALDGACRAGYTPKQIFQTMLSKHKTNLARKWPVPGDQNQPTEHISDKPASAASVELPGIPRRMRLDLFTPAERAIYDALAVVEGAGASVHLTDAGQLLQAARAKVADHVDGIPERLTP